MANDLQNYLTGSAAGLDLMADWTPVSRPDLAAAVGGYQLGINVPDSQLSAAMFTATTLRNVWSVMPPKARTDLSNVITGIVDSLATGTAAIEGTIENVLGGIMKGLGSTFAYVELMSGFAEFIVNLIASQIEDNDERRYEARLKCVEMLQEAGPITWTGDNWFNMKYKRKIAGKSDPYNFAWPPDSDWGLAIKAGVPRSCDLGDGGGSNLAPKDSSCQGSFSLFPIYMPLFGNRALGSPGPFVSMRRGMERAPGGGARIWELMSAMQGSLLTDPIMNLQANAESVWWRMQSFLAKVWGPSLAQTLERDEIRIDPEFDADNDGTGFYYTPGRLIGAYGDDGSGSLTHPSLTTKAVRLHTQTAPSDFGGFGISLADYNTVVSSTCQFLSLRVATLRRRSFCERAVDSSIVDLMPEMAARKAVIASADGAAAPAIGGGGAQPGLLLTRPKKSRPILKSGGGLVAVAGVAIAAAATLRK